MVTFFAGLGLGLSLIVAIGAQNVYLLRQAVRREHVGIVVTVCVVSDAVLILTGVSGIGFALKSMPWLTQAARLLGAAFLLGYAALAARRALAPVGMDLSVPQAHSTGSLLTRTAPHAVLATTLALTWLNPHVYLDTVFLLGSVASTHGDQRWVFAAGAIVGSIVWFCGLGLGARRLGTYLSSPRAWRILDGIIAATMTALALGLVLA